MEKKVILAVAAHPDDMDFGASGTVAKWVNEGANCYYCICTDGSRGSSDASITHKNLSQIRRDEQIRAGKVLGLTDVFFLNYIDTQLEPTQALKEDLVKIIRKIRPNIVITLDPTFYYKADFNGEFGFINHSDHRSAGSATMDAVYPLARDRLTFEHLATEGLGPWDVDELLLVSFLDNPNYVVDISDTIEQKLKALKQHRSQMGEFEQVEERIRQRCANIGQSHGFTYAEGFTRIKIGF